MSDVQTMTTEQRAYTNIIVKLRDKQLMDIAIEAEAEVLRLQAENATLTRERDQARAALTWTSVKTSLPPTWAGVLGADEEGSTWKVHYRGDGTWGHYRGDEDVVITHWMTLPARAAALAAETDEQ